LRLPRAGWLQQRSGKNSQKKKERLHE
jgi:hypothetical protein